MEKILPVILTLLSFTAYCQSSEFVSNLTNSKTVSYQEAYSGYSYKYLDGRTFTINVAYQQIDLIFQNIDENNRSTLLHVNFGCGYLNPKTEEREPKENITIQFGQYDFDGDDVDELVIAIQDNSEESNLCINVFQLKPNGWTLIGNLTSGMVVGEPKAMVKSNFITVPRNLRGFFYRWTFESGKFKDTGDY